MDNDCGFTRRAQWFRYRAAAIIIENGAVLAVKKAFPSFLAEKLGGFSPVIEHIVTHE